MGYAVGLIGLAAPMAAVAAYVRYTSRAERRRRDERLAALHTPSPMPPPAAPTDNFDAWQAGFSTQAEPAPGETDKP